MRILIVGGGGREHALAWKLKHDNPAAEILAAPGNPGIAGIGRCLNVKATDVDGLLALAEREQVTFTVVGPEAPLSLGIVDRFRTAGRPIFGPTAAAARVETSKRFAKDLMLKHGIPTASARTFTTIPDAKAEIRRLGAPVVVKASGIAAGKGVIVAMSVAEAEAAVDDMLDAKVFGDAGAEVLIEEFMEGEELSLFALTDGTHALTMLGAQDHKRIGEGDTGPNTGGMGAYLPVSTCTPELVARVRETIILPMLAAMRAEGCAFTGLLYAGLMLTKDGPKVVEFNCRFGDPETQAVLPMMASSLLEPMQAIAEGRSIAALPALAWKTGAAITTVVAAEGYPGTARSGDVITLPSADPGVTVFHAGTATNAKGELVTAGGRVLAVTAVAPTLAEAQAKSRGFAERVQFTGRQLRRDIGWRELARAR
ncbi:phosphoribosylamine--glycine ligase [Pseudogemmatithrix spongiicola]|uniref:Phosphoribosylamine--glycine ligase n=1 Tax=Pseudogemmatithrix spongiicola TaxID=3062599 RepID=A0AA49JW15_9BACT|nr:phosphoribosylamine--glycine ligase [Gemmatimonadaceae bacterium 'strain 138']WKW15842.1 phosphoribosylamine--glycine ligase [Gemmatimonadaceae bacterium 'strain 318']